MERDPKRLRISIEPHDEQKIYETSPEGRETVIVEPSPAEKFARLLSQIDFEKLNKKKENQEKLKNQTEIENKEQQSNNENKKSSSESTAIVPTTTAAQQQPNKWAWENVAQELFLARLEMEQLIAMTSLLQGNPPTLAVLHLQKAPPSLLYYNADLALREFPKKRELREASEILSRGAAALKKIVTTEQLYFDDLLQIRKKWLISSQPITNSKKIPSGTRPTGKLFVDYSYRSAGSGIRMEAELSQTSTGKVNVLLPSSLNKRLRIFSSEPSNDNSKKLESLSEYSDLSSSQLDCLTQLSLAQHSQYETELFQSLVKTALTKKLSAVQVVENDIRISSDISTTLIIQLKTLMNTNNSNNNNGSMNSPGSDDAMDDSQSTPGIPGMTPQELSDGRNDSSMMEEEFSKNSHRDVPHQVVNIVLQQLLQRQFHKNLTNRKNIPTNDQKDKESRRNLAPLKKKEELTMLDNVVLLYRHFCFIREVNRVLSSIATGLPHFYVHWHLLTKRKFLSSFEIKLENTYALSVTVDKMSVYVSNGSCSRQTFFTPNELGKFILLQISLHLIQHLQRFCKTLGLKTKNSLTSLLIISPAKTIEISLTPNDTKYVIEVGVTRLTSGKRITDKYSWNEMLGSNVHDKLNHLLSSTNLREKNLRTKLRLNEARSQNNLSRARHSAATNNNNNNTSNTTPVVDMDDLEAQLKLTPIQGGIPNGETLLLSASTEDALLDGAQQRKRLTSSSSPNILPNNNQLSPFPTSSGLSPVENGLNGVGDHHSFSKQQETALSPASALENELMTATDDNLSDMIL